MKWSLWGNGNQWLHATELEHRIIIIIELWLIDDGRWDGGDDDAHVQATSHDRVLICVDTPVCHLQTRCVRPSADPSAVLYTMHTPFSLVSHRATRSWTRHARRYVRRRWYRCVNTNGKPSARRLHNRAISSARDPMVSCWSSGTIVASCLLIQDTTRESVKRFGTRHMKWMDQMMITFQPFYFPWHTIELLMDIRPSAAIFQFAVIQVCDGLFIHHRETTLVTISLTR